MNLNWIGIEMEAWTNQLALVIIDDRCYCCLLSRGIKHTRVSPNDNKSDGALTDNPTHWI